MFQSFRTKREKNQGGIADGVQRCGLGSMMAPSEQLYNLGGSPRTNCRRAQLNVFAQDSVSWLRADRAWHCKGVVQVRSF